MSEWRRRILDEGRQLFCVPNTVTNTDERDLRRDLVTALRCAEEELAAREADCRELYRGLKQAVAEMSRSFKNPKIHAELLNLLREMNDWEEGG